jgi:hypothetical protein
MNKFYTILLLFLCFSATSLAQEKTANRIADSTQDGTNFYPNPVTNGKIYIVSKSSEDKDVTIYDVLGKKVFQATASNKELNISLLSSGLYIIKINDGDTTTARKLIIK